MTEHHSHNHHPPSLHPLDEALNLTPGAPGQYTGHTTRTYWNMVGPYGGLTAATLMQGVLQHPALLGEPVALTLNYAGAQALGPFCLHATPVRTNRSTQHWTLAIEQPGAEPRTETGADAATTVTTTGTIITAMRRATWSASDAPMPTVPAPQQCAPLPDPPVEWLQRYAMRPITGAPPDTWDGREADSLSQLWMRDALERPLDFCALAALADLFFPRIWLRRARRVPIGTVSMSVYFHADAALLAETGTGWLLGQARGQAFRNGFFDQTAQLWNEAGVLLATSHQLVYYKE